VPPALVNGVLAGQRMEVKYSHFTDYTSYKWMRVFSRTVKQLNSGDYELRLRLVGDADGTIGGVGAGNSCSALTESGSYYPLGSDNPGVWNMGAGPANVSDGVSYYLVPGMAWPIEPTPGAASSWHFATWDSGGAGTVDYPGSCTYSFLRVMVRGDGTLVIHTEVESEAQTLSAILRHHVYTDPDTLTGGVDVIDEVQTGIAVGSDITFDISTHDGQNCTHWVDVRDEGAGCGAGWGFGYAGSDWTLAS
jgi:hypothetical protein